MTRFLSCLSLLVALMLPAPLLAATFPGHDDYYVNDYANLLDPTAEGRLRSGLETLKRTTGVEMTVLTLPSWRSYSDDGQSLQDYATDLFNSWGIGKANRNDGILVLVASQDRDTRIVLGRGYDEGYDLMAQNVTASWFLPAFRKGDFQHGIEQGTDEIIARIVRPHVQGLPPEQPVKTLLDRAFPWIFGAFAAFVVGGSMFGRLAGDWSYRFRRCPQCGQVGMHRDHVLPQATVTDPATGTTPVGAAPGTGRIVVHCLHCSYHDDRPWRTGSSRSSSDRGGGGFGGGRSSGGGASGHW